jgi:hypothetical protein
MPRTKTIEAEPAPKTPVTEKIIEVDDEAVVELEDKPEIAIIPGLEPEDEDAEEEETLDAEEVDPFGDTWEQ